MRPVCLEQPGLDRRESRAPDEQSFVAAGFAGEQDDIAGGQTRNIRQVSDQRIVGFTVDGRGLKADLDRIPVETLHLISRSARGGVDIHNGAVSCLCDPTHAVPIHKMRSLVESGEGTSVG